MGQASFGSIFDNKTPDDFLKIKFHKKNKQAEIFFYSSEFVHALPLHPRQLVEMANCLLMAAWGMDAPICGVELHILNDGQMAYFNSRYMGRTGPTNILSFPGGAEIPGSLALSLPSLLRESHLYGQDPPEYLLHLLIHGFGHLAGFEHGREMDDFTEELRLRYLQVNTFQKY